MEQRLAKLPFFLPRCPYKPIGRLNHFLGDELLVRLAIIPLRAYNRAMSKSAALFFGFLICAMPLTITAQPSGTSAVAQIDTECDAVLSATSQTTPVVLILQGKKWVAINVADFQSAGGARNPGEGTPHYAEVYKQGANYVYAREVSFDSSSQQHAQGLCFRSDGTLERARQAQNVPGLSSATAERAYYAADGTLIQKTPGFNEKDPTIAKTVKDLRYFSVLPPPQ